MLPENVIKRTLVTVPRNKHRVNFILTETHLLTMLPSYFKKRNLLANKFNRHQNNGKEPISGTLRLTSRYSDYQTAETLIDIVFKKCLANFRTQKFTVYNLVCVQRQRIFEEMEFKRMDMRK